MLLHACVFARFEDLSGLVVEWAEKSTSLLVVEHPAEGKTKRIHCHFLIDTDLSDDNPYRTSGKKILGEFFKRGNMWIAMRVQKGPHAGQPIDRNKTMVYMLKGVHTECFAKNFSKQEVETSRQAWIDSAKNDQPGEESGNEYFIKKHVDSVLKKYPSFRDYDRHIDDKYEDRMITLPSAQTELFDEIKHTAFMDLYYRKNRTVPQAQQYKQIAGSVFMRVMEHWGKLDDAAFTVLKCWY